MLRDNRRQGSLPVAEVKIWLCATDRPMSGWPHGPVTSYVAYDTTGLSHPQYKRLERWMEKNGGYIRVRTNLHPPKGKADDRVSLYTPPQHVCGDSG